MKLTIEIQDTILCAFVNYVFINDQGGISMGVKSLDTDDINSVKLAEKQEERSNHERKID